MNPIDSVKVSYQEENGDRYNIFALNSDGLANVTAYHILGYEDPSWFDTVTSHFAAHLNYYGLISEQKMSQQYPAGLVGSAFEDLYWSLKESGVVVLNINESNYRTYFDGTFAVEVPLDSSYTGMTSGLTATTLYSSYIWSPTALKLANSGCVIGGTQLDAQRCEGNPFYTAELLGVGNPLVSSRNERKGGPRDDYRKDSNNFISRVAFLMTDDVYYTFTGGTGSSISWGYNFGVENRFAKGARTIMTDFNNTFNQGYYDKVQGMIDVDAGLVFLWGEVAKAFDWTQFTGDKYTTGATPNTSGTTIMDVSDWDYQVGVSVSAIITPEMYRYSTNPSLIGETNCNTVFNTVCFFDKFGGLLAKAVVNTPIELNGQYKPMDFFLPIASTIQDVSDRVYTNPL